MKWNDNLRIFVLSAAIKYWQHMYYQKQEVIGDNTFDVMYKELVNLERKVGHSVHDSPTQNPGI